MRGGLPTAENQIVTCIKILHIAEKACRSLLLIAQPKRPERKNVVVAILNIVFYDKSVF
jgi:hypothetical protein